MFYLLIIFSIITIAYGIFITLAIVGFNHLRLKQNVVSSQYQPAEFISIVLSARNESATIINCLEQFEKQDFPKEKFEIIFESEKNTAKSLFNEEYNGNFYFYNKVGYIHKKKVSFYDEVSTLVVVANKREKLLNRDFYCLISTEKKSYTEIFRSYKERFKIEVFFRNMKNYIGLESSRTHHQDKISNHFALCIFSYIIVENLSKQLKKTFFQTLIYIQTNKRKSIEKLLYPIFNSFKSILNL